MATAKKPAAAGKDPRGSAPPPAAPKARVEEKHDHHAAPKRQRLLTGVDDDAVVTEGKKERTVTVRIPRAFRLQVLDEMGSRIVHYEAGVDEMPESHALHEYSIANGVEVVDGK